MKLWKKLTCLILCLFMVAALVPIVTPEADAATTKLGTQAIAFDDIVLGGKPLTADDIWYNNSKYVEITDVTWDGELDANGNIKAGVAYFMYVTLKVKAGVDAAYAITYANDVEVNGEPLFNHYGGAVLDNNKTLVIRHRFPYYFKEDGTRVDLKFIDSLKFDVPAPAAGEKPATAADVSLGNSNLEISNLKWVGALDENGCFKAGVKYKLQIDVKVKEGKKYTFFYGVSTATINKKDAVATVSTTELGACRMSYTFPATKNVATVTENGNTRMTITAPKVGEWPDYSPIIPEDWKSYVKNVEWSGTLDKYGRFQAGKSYTLTVTVRVKPTSPYYKFWTDGTNIINNAIATIKSVSDDRKEMTLTYKFSALEGDAAPAPTGTVVDAFEPGDYGMLKITKGTITYLKDINDTNSFYDYNESTDRIAGSRTEINLVVLEANVVSDQGYTYHAVLKDNKIAYISAWDGLSVTYGELTRFGNRTPGSYHNLWNTDEDFTVGMISSILTDAVVVGKDGVPKMEWWNDSDINGYDDFYADSIVYSTDKAEPYSLVTAVVTYKAKEGHFFYEGITDKNFGFYNVPLFTLLRHNSAEIKYVDRNTLQVTYTVFVEDLYEQDTYTDEMKAYVEQRVELDEVGFIKSYFNVGGTQKQYVATAEFYNPLITWFKSMKFPLDVQEQFEDHYKTRRYAAPTDDGYVQLQGAYYSTITKEIVQIYDLDVSDMFPGQVVGEWVQINGGDFYPKAYLRDIDVTDNNVNGTPGHHVDPVFSFAGGSGTKEDPYLIATAEQLNAMRLVYDKVYYKLIADIDLSKWGNWVPIGGSRAYGGWPSQSSAAHYNTFCFSGVLDGNGHTISGMTIKVDADSALLHGGNSEAFFGLFAATAGYSKLVGSEGTHLIYDDWGVIKNLTLKDFTIDVTFRDVPANFSIYAGGIAGLSTSSKIINCKSVGGKINVQVVKNLENDGTPSFYAAGLVGLSRDAEFENCSSTSTVSVRRNVGEDEFLEFKTNALVNKTTGKDSTSIKNSKGTGKVTVTNGEPVAATSKFTDVPTSQYYFKPVEWAVGQAITTGTTTTTFSPNNTCTRAQILTFLWRAVGAPKVSIANPFTDVKTSDYFYYAALWAYNKGMVSGTKFAGDTLCTREATVVYLWQYVGSPAVEATNKFTDVPAGAAYAQAVAWAVSKGITTGTSATTFSPTATCTRGQIATFLYRTLGTPVNTK